MVGVEVLVFLFKTSNWRPVSRHPVEETGIEAFFTELSQSIARLADCASTLALFYPPSLD